MMAVFMPAIRELLVYAVSAKVQCVVASLTDIYQLPMMEIMDVTEGDGVLLANLPHSIVSM